MGPRRDRRGEKPRGDADDLEQELQWGRVVIDAESFGGGVTSDGRVVASMGPRRDRRGEVRLRRRSRRAVDRFNGAAS